MIVLNETNELKERMKWINKLNDGIEKTWLLGLILLDELNWTNWMNELNE